MSKMKIIKSAPTRKVILLGFFFLISALAAQSQPAARRKDFSSSSSAASASSAKRSLSLEEEDLIKPARPSVANPAEFQKPGVLQIEYGYDADFRAADFRLQQTLPLDIRFAAHSRLLLEAEIEIVKSERFDRGGGTAETGVGDVRLGFQAVALKDTEKHPALAFSYVVKLPTASESKMLGSGRYDHRLTALLSKKIGEKTDFDVNAAYINAGREDGNRRASGALAAISLAREFENKFGFDAELSGNSLDDIQPRGVYALGALTYKVNKRLEFDAGMRFGLSNDAPRVGFFAGFTVGVADFFKRK